MPEYVEYHVLSRLFRTTYGRPSSTSFVLPFLLLKSEVSTLDCFLGLQFSIIILVYPKSIRI